MDTSADSRWPCSVRRGSAAAGSNLAEGIMSVSCVCSVFVSSGPCDELIIGTGESYRVCVCVYLLVCDIETSTKRQPRAQLGCSGAKRKKIYTYLRKYWGKKVIRQRWADLRNPHSRKRIRK